MEAREQTFGRSSQAATRRSAANILFGAAGAGTWRQTRLKRLGLMQGQPITLKNPTKRVLVRHREVLTQFPKVFS
jgi:hypothetical protein